MLLTLEGHAFRYECENLCRLFFPYSRARVEEGACPQAGEPFARTVITPRGDAYQYQVTVSDGARTVEKSWVRPDLEEYGITDLLYRAFSELTGVTPAWGMLTGIHPVKLLGQYVRDLGREDGLQRFQEHCHVSPEKAHLAARVLAAQTPAIADLGENDFSLYVGIPFCPTRCAYCSFVSQEVEKVGRLVPSYLEALEQELARTGELARELGLRLRTVYVGGGTPTTLDPAQLTRLCETLQQDFDWTACQEFTVEAGRPDTITPEKLAALKAAGVGRISINPQTLSDQVLENIGRRHTAADFFRAFALAREAGFDNINTDLIVGLPGDDLAGFQRSLDGVIALGAENITVHALALKRAARLVTEGGDLSLHAKSEETAAMVEYSIRRLTQEGYEPYYLYRQTRMAGNLENTGWARPGALCRYNVITMDECGSVIACGAGAVSKLKDPYSDRLERIFNVKLPLDYLQRLDEIVERKEGVKRLYEQFRG